MYMHMQLYMAEALLAVLAIVFFPQCLTQLSRKKKKEAFIEPVAQLCAVNNACSVSKPFRTVKSRQISCIRVRKAWARFIAKVWFLHCNIVMVEHKTTITGERN